MKGTPRANLIIDALMFIFVLAMAGTGVLVKFVLIPGRVAWRAFGSNVRLYLWGMDRHEWGTIHLVLGLGFIILLVVHVSLHVKVLIRMYRGVVKTRKARRIVACIFLVVCVMLVLFPFLGRTEVRPQGQGYGGGGRAQIRAE